MQWLSQWYQEQHDLTVDVDVQDDVEVEDEDVRVMVFSCVRELLFNTLKHSQVRRANIAVSLVDNTRLQIVVSDKGVGFDPEAIRAREGVKGGFGLFSLRERLTALTGSLDIESSPGKGCRSILQAPLLAGSAIKSAPVENMERLLDIIEEHTPPQAERQIKILIADDHAVVRTGSAMVFNNESDFYVLGQASNGRQAIDLSRLLLPDIIIMDVNMPEMDGIEATRILTKELPHSKVIGFTISDDKRQEVAMREAGAVDVLSKTTPMETIISVIRKHGRHSEGIASDVQGEGDNLLRA